MTDVRDKSGKVIATIHDEKAFSELLDIFEKCLAIYDLTRWPFKNMNIWVEPNMLENAARELQKIRDQIGDIRVNLYPVNIPK